MLDSIGTRVERPNLQVALLRKLLDGEIRVRLSANRTQASRFSERLQAVLDRYEARQLTSAEVVKHLVELAKELRDTRRRNEKLGLSAEEVAFYDALAGHSDDWKADPELAEIAADLVRSIRSDLSVDWTDRANVEAAIRARIKRLLRKHHYSPPVRRHGGAKQLDFDSTAQLILDQAREIYRYWPEVEADRLFV